MEKSKYVIFYFNCYDDGPHFLGYADTEEEAKLIIANKKKIDVCKNCDFIEYEEIEKINTNFITSKELGYKFNFLLGEKDNEQYRMKPINWTQYAFEINDKNDIEGLIYNDKNKTLTIKIKNPDEEVAIEKAKFYYKELVKYIIINNCSIDEALNIINEKINKMDL